MGVVAALGLLLPGSAAASRDMLTDHAERAMLRGVEFFRRDVAVQGGYVWEYSADLSWRRGEGETTPTQAWTQAPGTPAVGSALLAAYIDTGKPQLLAAAIEAAHALTATQLRSGGWWSLIEFDPKARRAWCYRAGADCQNSPLAKSNKVRNTTVIDDDITQGALRFLMSMDAELEQRDARIHDAALYGLDRLVAAQYPNGAWPNRSDRAADRRLVEPRLRASFATRTPKVYEKVSDAVVYIVNDDAISDVIRTMLLGHELYGRDRYLGAARRGGDFLLAAQLPAPQRGWAQLYNRRMQPIWGRKFEPPAVASRETRGAIEALLALGKRTGEPGYLAAAQEAASWLAAAPRVKGQWARFYELGTNRPLYVDRDYRLTYQPDRTPAHYSLTGTYGIPETLERCRRATDPNHSRADRDDLRRSADTKGLAQAVRAAVAGQDRRGRWIENGRIRSATFIRNLQLLSRYLAAARGRRSR